MLDRLNDNYDIEINEIIKNEESTDGNVYMLKNDNNKYIMKIYDNLKHAELMVNIHHMLSNLYIPRIINTKDNNGYLKYDNKYIVIYSFLQGIQICEIDFDNLIPAIAKEVRRMHDLINDNELGMKELPFTISSNLNRYSILHFDLTKHNIFYNEENNEIGFIDFDDVKYGPSICEVAIIISLLFLSKKRGVNKEGMDLFIDSYYGNDTILKQKELKYLKEYALKWVDYILDNNNFDTSLKESFEVKKKLIMEYL